MSRSRSKKFTVEPGREIYLHGKEFISISREGQTPSTDADAVTRAIVKMLNASRSAEVRKIVSRAR